MNILSLENVSKAVKDGPLFQAVTFGLEQGERAGLVGLNGSGKSTLLKLISGELVADGGTIARSKDISVGYLSQETTFNATDSVTDFFLRDPSRPVLLLATYRRMLADGAATATQLAWQAHLIEEAGAWDVQTAFNSMLGEINGPGPDDPMATLSGGMVKKVALARLLALHHGLLLLDEPTNHVDIDTIEWLEDKLAGSKAAILMATHDRYVLDRLCTSIMEIDGCRLHRYPGGFSSYLELREQRLEAQRHEQDRLRTILRRELEWMRRGPKARTGKDSGRLQRIEAMQDAVVVKNQDTLNFGSQSHRIGKKILELEAISKEYDGKAVIRPFSHSFIKADRIGLVGPNGSGKTTFLEIVSGRIQPDSGSVDTGINTVFGYYDQLDKGLDRTKGVLQHISEIAERFTLAHGVEVSASAFLQSFGFPVSCHRTPIGLLSGGERRRLALTTVLAGQPNFLLLDEPTNDLDVDTIARLEEYLLDFPGCLLVVSHDRAFLDRVTTKTFAFETDGTVRMYAGSYGECRSLIAAHLQQEAGLRTPARQETKQERSEGKRKLSFKEARELEEVTDEIDSLERKKKELEALFSVAGHTPASLTERTKEYRQVSARLEELFIRWEELASRS